MQQALEDELPIWPSSRLRLAALAGYFGPILGLMLILIAVYEAINWFTLTDYPLSAMGVVQEGQDDWVVYFNSGVVVAGLGSLGFSWGLFRLFGTNTKEEGYGCRLLQAGAICLILVGLVPMDQELPHMIFALGFFGLIPFGILLLGEAWKSEPETTSQGFLSAMLGRYLLLTLLLLIAMGAMGNEGLAIPELLGIVPMTLWQWGMSAKMWRHGTQGLD